MKKIKLLLPTIILIVIVSGCTSQKEIIQLVKTLPEVSEFLEQHPNADIRAVSWNNDTVSKKIDEIREDCGDQVDVGRYWKVVISENNFDVTVWVNDETKEPLCIIKQETKTTSTTTSTRTTTSTTTSTTSTTTSSTNTTTSSTVPISEDCGSAVVNYNSDDGSLSTDHINESNCFCEHLKGCSTGHLSLSINGLLAPLNVEMETYDENEKCKIKTTWKEEDIHKNKYYICSLDFDPSQGNEETCFQNITAEAMRPLYFSYNISDCYGTFIDEYTLSCDQKCKNAGFNLGLCTEEAIYCREEDPHYIGPIHDCEYKACCCFETSVEDRINELVDKCKQKETQDEIDDCLFSLVFFSKIYKTYTCQDIVNENIISDCYARTAYAKKDVSICDEAPTEETRDTCISYYNSWSS